MQWRDDGRFDWQRGGDDVKRMTGKQTGKRRGKGGSGNRWGGGRAVLQLQMEQSADTAAHTIPF